MRNKLIIFISILIPPLIALYIFFPLLFFYFFQDDWFNFNITNINNIQGYISFFKFRNDIIAYRPVGLQTFFFVYRHLFDLNALPIRIINFGLLALSYTLVMQLFFKISKSKFIGYFTGTLWIVSSIHFMNIGVINYNLLGTFFWLIIFLLYLKYIETSKKIFYLLSILTFVFTLGIFENVLSWPFAAGVLSLIVLKKSFKDVLKIFLPFAIISVAYLLIRQIFIAHLDIIEYETTFNVASIKTFFWYVLWAFNVPEEFKKQILHSLLVFNPIFFKEYKGLIISAFAFAVAIIMLGIIVPVVKARRAIRVKSMKLVLYSIFWFCLTIFPVLLLPNHNFIMYLTLPLIGLCFLISYLIFLSKLKILYPVIFVVWLLSSINTLNFYKVNFFMVSSQKVSRDFTINMKNKFPILPHGAVVYYPLNFKGDRQALLGQNAIRALYKDQTLVVLYSYQDIKNYFIVNPGENLFIY